MKGRLLTIGLIAVALVALMDVRAQAFFHFWRFTEFFSSADGSVQFIEMGTTVNGEVFSSGVQIQSSSTGKVFTFPSDLSGTTANKRLLIATPGFASLSGAVTPDFTLPSASFFNPAGDTVFATGIDSRTFSSVPTDGVLSLNYPSGTELHNTPTNFAGAAGHVMVPSGPMPTGDYNGDNVVNAADYVLWRDTLTQSVSPNGSGADGSGNGTIDDADYDFWKARFGSTVPGAAQGLGSLAVPEPITPALITAGLCLLAFRRRR